MTFSTPAHSTHQSVIGWTPADMQGGGPPLDRRWPASRLRSQPSDLEAVGVRSPESRKPWTLNGSISADFTTCYRDQWPRDPGQTSGERRAGVADVGPTFTRCLIGALPRLPWELGAWSGLSETGVYQRQGPVRGDPCTLLWRTRVYNVYTQSPRTISTLQYYPQ